MRFLAISVILIYVFVVLQQVVAELNIQDIRDAISEAIKIAISEAITPIQEDIKILKNITLKIQEDVLKIQEDVLKIQEDVRNLTSVTQQGFIGVHNIGRDRVSVAKLVTAELKLGSFGCSGSLTRHAFLYKGYVGELTTPHMNCDKANATQLAERNKLVLLHPTKDLGVISHCPFTETVLDISVSTIPLLGDNVLAYGFGDTADVWTGPISKMIPNKHDILFDHWSGSESTSLTSGEYLVQSAQHNGMSGAATSNGCGYLGMAHAVEIAQKGFGVFAAIIAAKDIHAFIENLTVTNPKALKRYEDCAKSDKKPLDIVSFPIFPFMNCNNEENVLSSDITIMGESKLP